eukprot:8038615-Pyramimonas_sp.AAC.1
MSKNWSPSSVRALSVRALCQSFRLAALEIALQVVRAAAEHGACMSVRSLRARRAASRVRRLNSWRRTMGV